MVHSRISTSALVLGLLASSSTASRIRPRQVQAQASPSSTAGNAASATASATDAPTTTQDVPQALLSIANSLISENYPSGTLNGVATLSWPSTIVIGTNTYNVPPRSAFTANSAQVTSKSTTLTSVASKATQAEGVKDDSGGMSDKRLAIIIGVVLGVVALAVMGLVFFCMHRRKKDNGSFFLRRTTPSMRSNGSWMPGRNDTMGTTTYVSTGSADPYQSKYAQTTVVPRGDSPPMSAHPAFMHNESSRSTSDDNPFYTPGEGSMTNLHSHELDSQQIQEADYAQVANRRSSSSVREDRPPTPFSPLMMMQMPGPGAKAQIHQNPFASPEDAEADDVVSPIMPPARNPERRYSPMVHYPSWDEVSAFSFSGDERDARQEDGGDGWRAERERRDGRYELA